MNYERDLTEELEAIWALRDTHVDRYACAPECGWVLVCYDDLEGYYLYVNNRGFITSGGPWDREYAISGFQEEVKLLGGES